MPFEQTEHKEGIVQALREGATIEAVTQLFPVSKKTVMRYAKALKDDKLDKPKLPKEPAQKVGGELATVVQPSKGAIVFTLGEHKISLNPQHLYDAYLYYEDISLRHEIDEDFSLAIKDAMKYVWERLNQHKSEREGAKITIEGG